MPNRTFIFAGGGTGGHLFPGLAIADQLRNRLGRDCRFIFICSVRPLDGRILGDKSVEHVAIASRPFSVRPRGFVRFCRSWGRCVRAARGILKSAKSADSRAHVHVVAMGGFVAPPVVQAARVERVGVTLVNLDAVPGKANRWVARHAGAVFTTFEVSRPYAARWTTIPPIVRAGAVAPAPAHDCRLALGLEPDRPTLMISGGSQGARSINLFMTAFVRSRRGALDGWQILHQAGDSDSEAVAAAYADAGVPARVEPFVSDMAHWWGAADLAVGRAGAGTVAEAWANRAPILFMPYPHHRDEHQRHNAEPLVKAGGAVLARDLVDEVRNDESVGPVLEGLLTDAGARAKMRDALQRLGPADGAERVAAALAGS